MDLTVIMLTPNRVPETWAKFHKEKLLEAIDGLPIITVSAKPLDWGINIHQDGYGLSNIYRQMLKAAKLATTEWIAMADDDTLYPKSHFKYRPKEKGFFYNLNRWHIFTEGDPFYFYKPWHGNGLMIATRELLIKALENRFKVYGEHLSAVSEHELGTRKETIKEDLVKARDFYSDEPVLSFYHQYALKYKKRSHPVRAYDIPLWGKASEIQKKFI